MRFASCSSPEKIEDILHSGEDDDCCQHPGQRPDHSAFPAISMTLLMFSAVNELSVKLQVDFGQFFEYVGRTLR
jgi:hypothetical protein